MQPVNGRAWARLSGGLAPPPGLFYCLSLCAFYAFVSALHTESLDEEMLGPLHLVEETAAASSVYSMPPRLPRSFFLRHCFCLFSLCLYIVSADGTKIALSTRCKVSPLSGTFCHESLPAERGLGSSLASTGPLHPHSSAWQFLPVLQGPKEVLPSPFSYPLALHCLRSFPGYVLGLGHSEK